VTIELDLQVETAFEPVPAIGQFRLWVETALQGAEPAVLTLRLVDEDESGTLNSRYRGKEGPTNVLSFPADLPEEVDLPLLGDIVICAPLVAFEAQRQGKTADAHWAHLTVHGVLHLLGHDHQAPAEAEAMESLETALLASLEISNPYR
jgi:probable rRNA maturation factor